MSDAGGAKAQGGGEYKMSAVGFQQVGRANVRLTSPRNKRDHVHQSLGRFAALESKIADFVQGQNVVFLRTLGLTAQIFDPVVFFFAEPDSRKRHEACKTVPIASDAVFSQINCRNDGV